MRISLDSAVTQTFDNNKLLKLFRNFNITETEQDINEFVAIDEQSSHLFQDTTSQRLQAISILDIFYAKSVILEGELPSAEMQAVVSNNYGKLQLAFYNVRIILKKTCQ